MEMRDIALGHRTLARKSRVDLTSIIRAEMSDGDWARVVEGIEGLRDSKVWIDDSPGLTIHDIRARARAFTAKHGKCLIAVDYLQYISSAGRGEVKDHVSECSRGLKNLARELKTPVIALSQLSRALEARANKRPIMSDLRESGAIEQDADIIMFVYRDEVYNPDTKEPGVAEIIVGKNRNGPTGVAKLGYANTLSSFYSLDTAY
jgi:replicative DNA helicase